MIDEVEARDAKTEAEDPEAEEPKETSKREGPSAATRSQDNAADAKRAKLA